MDLSVNGVLAGAAKVLTRVFNRDRVNDPGRPVPRRIRGRDPASYRGARRNAMRAVGKLADWRLGPWHSIARGERVFTVLRLGLPQKITRPRFQFIHASLAAMSKAFA